MANNPYKNKVVYNGTTLIDLTGDTVTPSVLMEGYTAHDASGALITGTASGGGVVISDTTDSHGGTIREITTANVITLGSKSITANGTYTASTDNLTGYNTVTVNVGGGGISLQSKSVDPTESIQTVTADSGYDGLSSVEVGAISPTYVGSNITRRSSSDLTASGATVSVPSGYYASNASKAIASGSATTPATTITANPSISVSSSGLITATASASKSVTPTVSAGYVSSGTSGTVTVSGSNTQQLTTQAAKTVTPSETSQTAVASGVYTTGTVTVGAISTTYVGSGVTRQEAKTITPTKSSQTAVASGVYTTGAVTVAAIPAQYITTTDATASAADIASGETAYVNGSKVTGTLTFATYYTGSSTPSASQGSDGDIYLKVVT